MSIYWVDPDATDDTGDGSKSNPWKTPNHTVSPGDEVRFKKSPLTTMSWTVSGTHGQRDLTASSDPSGDIAADDVIKVDGEYYIVRGISGTTIQTYKPFLGTTGSGKTCEKVGVFDIGSTYWQVYSGGNSSNRVYYKGGYDWSTETQDGYTFFKSSASYAYYTSNNKSWFECQRLCTVKASSYPFSFYGYQYNFKNAIIGFGSSYSIYATPGVSSPDGIYFENVEAQNKPPYIYGRNAKLKDCDFWLYDSVYAQFGYSNYDWHMFLENCRFDGSTYTYGAVQARGDLYCSDVKLGSVLSNTKNAFYLYSARIQVKCVNCQFSIEDTRPQYNHVKLVSIRHNQTANDNRTLLGYWRGSTLINGNGMIQSDTSVYRSSSPSLKFTPKDANHEVFEIFQIPVSSGSRTVSVYLRKDSSYNGSYRPKMIVRYYTGTTTCAFVETEVEMSNVNDTWTQVSTSITLGDDQVIEVEIRGIGNAGHFWCDDLTVT